MKIKTTKRNRAIGRGKISFPVEFHIARSARERYNFSRRLYGLNGNVVFTDIKVIRDFAEKINRQRQARLHPERAVRAGQVNSIGLIDEIWHLMARRYREQVNPEFLPRARRYLGRALGKKAFERTLLTFVEEFPGRDVYRGKKTEEEYLSSSTKGAGNRDITMEEMMMLSLSNRNPAFRPLRDLFDDSNLRRRSVYPRAMKSLEKFLRGEPSFGPAAYSLLDFLMAPILAAPDSLEGQLGYIREHWGKFLPPSLQRELLVGMDIIKEEEKSRLPGPGPARAPDFNRGKAGLIVDYERYSPDLDWMGRVVLLVKNVYVWLDQLSRRYHHPIRTLDRIPDQELDILRRWGFTSLWLIGLWEKSSASWKIKRRCGNPEAGASAYSLYDYVISADLGGEAALKNLKERALRRGIRLASDMVPNHTGIYSKWVIEEPRWFVQSRNSPFPGYTFSGPDLSADPRVGIFIEDRYWSRRDAAVVFKRLDRATGQVRYLYHGNDGTSMPWNDTAQLDFTRAEVREAVIRTILQVARKFSVIRFDAAMVLTKQHFHRLWYPAPGEGGDIPSRAGKGISRAEFNKLFPREFWREVVDRVAAEVPDTLLLAEAFWLLEGYFVRTLGMHRVYNSAFMNMLKLELNSDYRNLLKNTLEFDPQILKRYVNFMSNPDEATAIAQFGRGDKYIGVCTMMVTLPGLPLFGHGQVEGLAERYGMEYRKAYWDEPMNYSLVKRHEAEIFPLMKKRYLFSDVINFVLYDFFRDEGGVDEDVFAYSNRAGRERALIVYNNRFRNTAGWIRTSAAWSRKGRRGGRKLVRTGLAAGLGLRAGEDDFCLFRDQRSGLEYIRSSRSLREKGLRLRMDAYQTHVFTNIREIRDGAEKALSQLESSLQGKGVKDMDRALKKVHFAPLHRAFKELLNPAFIKSLLKLSRENTSSEDLEKQLAEIMLPPTEALLRKVAQQRASPPEIAPRARRGLLTVRAILMLSPPAWISSRYSRPGLKYLLSRISVEGSASSLRILLVWALLREVDALVSDTPGWLDKWLLREMVEEFFQAPGISRDQARRETELITILLSAAGPVEKIRSKRQLHLLGDILEGNEARRFQGYHWYDDILWFQGERLEELLYWLTAAGLISKAVRISPPGKPPRARGLVLFRAAGTLSCLAEESGYQVKKFRQKFPKPPRRKAKKRRAVKEKVKKRRAGKAKAKKSRAGKDKVKNPPAGKK